MSAVAALRDAIVSTDAAVVASVRPKQAPAKRAAPLDRATASTQRAAAKVADVAVALASLNPAVAAFSKLLTGGAREDWNAFRDGALSSLSGKTDKDFSASEFGAIVTRFVTLRASLAQSGISLPPVTIPQLEHSRGVPLWVYPLLAAAAIGGIVLWKLSGA